MHKTNKNKNYSRTITPSKTSDIASLRIALNCDPGNSNHPYPSIQPFIFNKVKFHFFSFALSLHVTCEDWCFPERYNCLQLQSEAEIDIDGSEDINEE